ncbi:distal tail protein Dit [Cytobacillus sp.]|uniref:distal tail protein Dit n=1 Tax=Cytobacillus sp. TaxID=2675269 RepID=UPI0035190217
MLKNGFTFNGERKPFVMTISKKRTYWPPVQRSLLDIPKVPGARLMHSKIGVRQIAVDVEVEGANQESLRKRAEELARWLITDEPAPLIFDDERDRTYFAIVEGEFDPTELAMRGYGTIQFICPDPYKYADLKPIKLYPSSSPTIQNVEVLGNIETYPVTRVEVQKKLNFFALVTGDDYLQIGEDAEVDQTIIDPETLVFSDSMAATSGWGQATYVDNGYIAGTIASDGSSFYPETFGTVIQPPQWQGPSVKKSIGKSLSDFRAEALVELQNKGNRTGMLEIYFLGSSNQTVAKIGIQDRHAITENVIASARIGDSDTGKWIATEEARNPEWWTNFKGVLRIERKEKRWTVYFSPIDSKGNHTYPRGSDGSLTYFDAIEEFDEPITQIQVAFRIYPNTTKADMKISDLKIWELNQKPATYIINIANPGDILEFDHYKNTIKKNGELLLGLKDFASNFFALKPGKNPVSFLPSDAGIVTISFRERYL